MWKNYRLSRIEPKRDDPVFWLRDVWRLVMVDVIAKLIVELLIFWTRPSTSSVIWMVLAGRLALLGYMIWLIGSRQEGWNEVGADSLGSARRWVAVFPGYLLFLPFFVYLGRVNAHLLLSIYERLGVQYQPAAQTVVQFLLSEKLSTPAWVALVLFIVVIGPCIEELMFRGVALSAFVGRWGGIGAVIASGVLFGTCHFDPKTVIPLSALGMLMAAARLVVGSLSASVVIHITHNAIMLAWVYFPLVKDISLNK